MQYYSVVDLESAADEEVLPDSKCFLDGKKFLFTRVVVEFSILHLPGVESDGMGDAIVDLL